MNPTPSFVNDFHRHQAEQLLQPVLIRVIDNLRKVIETSSWASTYEEQLLWPEGTTADEVAQVQQLAAQLEQADAEAAGALQQQLSRLPMPFPGYLLRLSQGDRTECLDVWQLCYQVCFSAYRPGVPAEVDLSLLDEVGDIDWLALDEKARQQVQKAFEQLPAPPSS